MSAYIQVCPCMFVLEFVCACLCVCVLCLCVCFCVTVSVSAHTRASAALCVPLSTCAHGCGESVGFIQSPCSVGATHSSCNGPSFLLSHPDEGLLDPGLEINTGFPFQGPITGEGAPGCCWSSTGVGDWIMGLLTPAAGTSAGSLVGGAWRGSKSESLSPPASWWGTAPITYINWASPE